MGISPVASVRARQLPARIMVRSLFSAPRSCPSDSEYNRSSTIIRLPACPPGEPLDCSSSTITGTSCKSAAALTMLFGVSANVRK